MSNEQNTAEKKLMELYYFAIGEGNFMKALERHCAGRGFGIEHIWCLFAGELEEWEEAYFGEVGVCYFFDYPAVDKDETIVLDYRTFYFYLKEASEQYLSRHQDEKNAVQAQLHEIKRKFSIT